MNIKPQILTRYPSSALERRGDSKAAILLRGTVKPSYRDKRLTILN